MTKEIVYIAEDGKKFFDEDSCYRYEQELLKSKISNSIFLFDEEGKKLPITASGFYSACFAISKSAEASKIAFKLGDGYDNPFDEEPGFWCYFENNWVNACDLLRNAEIIQNLLEKYGG